MDNSRGKPIFPPIRFYIASNRRNCYATAAVAAVSVSIASIAITVIAIIVVVYVAIVSSSVRLVFGTSICFWGKKMVDRNEKQQQQQRAEHPHAECIVHLVLYVQAI